MKHKMLKLGKKCDFHEPKNEESYVELVLKNGNRIISHGDKYLSGSDVHVLDKKGNEIGYWDSNEWAEDPELVMGAILSCAAGYVLAGSCHAAPKKQKSSNG